MQKLYINCHSKQKPKSEPSYRRQVVHPGESAAQCGTLLRIILSLVCKSDIKEFCKAEYSFWKLLFQVWDIYGIMFFAFTHLPGMFLSMNIIFKHRIRCITMNLLHIRFIYLIMDNRQDCFMLINWFFLRRICFTDLMQHFISYA